MLCISGKRPGTYPKYAESCDFHANPLTYAKDGKEFLNTADTADGVKFEVRTNAFAMHS
jgi:hypothetical protein